MDSINYECDNLKDNCEDNEGTSFTPDASIMI